MSAGLIALTGFTILAVIASIAIKKAVSELEKEERHKLGKC